MIQDFADWLVYGLFGLSADSDRSGRKLLFL